MDEITLFLSILIAGLSALLFIVSMISTARLRNIKLLLVGTAFLVFTIKGLLLVFEFLVQQDIAMILDIVIILLLYFAIVKK